MSLCHAEMYDSVDLFPKVSQTKHPLTASYVIITDILSQLEPEHTRMRATLRTLCTVVTRNPFGLEVLAETKYREEDQKHVWFYFYCLKEVKINEESEE